MFSAPRGPYSKHEPSGHFFHCPFQVGQILWVREGLYHKLDTPFPTSYSADDGPVLRNGAGVEWTRRRQGTSAMFMPRWASRITLEIADVRVQRVREISEEDTLAEGVDMESDFASACINVEDAHGPNDLIQWSAAITVFSELWDSINAKRGYGFDMNPWVWTITFNRGKPE
jgi:hypothetical protein